jgi:mono/diheme cytochrome c family protein
MRVRSRLLLVLVVLALAAAAFIGYSWRPGIEPVEPQAASRFDAAQVARGSQLALIGNCNSCHTAEGGAPYAGGRPLKTPFGTIHGTNITPCPDTGIGRWSEAAFTRALREGVDRSGRHLYPAFPYDHYTLMTDEDIRALYAFIMTREAVRAETPANQLLFPLNFRPLIAGWKLMFLDVGVFQPDPARDPAWNRGAYLVRGPAHCGGCHTPRNFLGAEKKGRFLEGGVTEGWTAPALNPASATPVPWTAESLRHYLRHGIADNHAITAGPMDPVIRNLAGVPEDDIKAIAAYVAAYAAQVTPEHKQKSHDLLARAALDATAQRAPQPPATSERDQVQRNGRALYAGACASCHDIGRQTSSGSGLHLGLATVVHLDRPGNLIKIILEGIVPPAGEPGRWMPAFAGTFTDAQLAHLAQYIRAEYSRLPDWKNMEDEVRKAKGKQW